MVNCKLIKMVSISIACMTFKLKLHHGCFFQRDPMMQYVGTSDSGSVIDKMLTSDHSLKQLAF